MPGGSPRLVVKDQGVALALGVGALVLASWCFGQAWEARGKTRPGVARWLAV